MESARCGRCWRVGREFRGAAIVSRTSYSTFRSGFLSARHRRGAISGHAGCGRERCSAQYINGDLIGGGPRLRVTSAEITDTVLALIMGGIIAITGTESRTTTPLSIAARLR
jgi:hypothetical protein